MKTYESRRNKRLIIEKRKKDLRRKIMCRLAFMFSILCVVVLLSVNIISTAFANNFQEYITVTVSSGDNLWSIAQRYNPDNKDIRYVIRKIERANGMSSEQLYVGDTINIPLN